MLVYIGWICGEWGKALICSSWGRDEDSLVQEESLFIPEFASKIRKSEPLFEFPIYMREFQDL